MSGLHLSASINQAVHSRLRPRNHAKHIVGVCAGREVDIQIQLGVRCARTEVVEDVERLRFYLEHLRFSDLEVL